VCPDANGFESFQHAMARRFKGSGKATKLKMMFRLIKGRLRDGYLNTSVNF
jgi:hypothetical protein